VPATADDGSTAGVVQPDAAEAPAAPVDPPAVIPDAAPGAGVHDLVSLRAEYDRLAAEVTKAKPDAPGYKALREAKRLAFAAWYTAAHP
jgi:hypothetical protein